MSDRMEKFIIENYGVKSSFSSFLPGISGIHGIPIWCFYVNRGQAVVSFGVQDKDHAIMEYYPAHQACQNVKRTGFRTFVRKDGRFTEPFGTEEKKHRMTIWMNRLILEETDEEHELKTRVTYFTLPEEPVGALVRKVELTNTAKTEAKIEVLDGMPALIPYGVDIASLKEMGQTVKAWMQVEREENNIAYFRVRASIEDSAAVQEVAGGNFSLCCLEDGTRLLPIADPSVVFGYDLSLEKPIGFLGHGIDELNREKQVMQNQFPCSFYGASARLMAGESLVLYQLIGQVHDKELLQCFEKKVTKGAYFAEKEKAAQELTDDLTEDVMTRTASPEFDGYCRYTYLDNILRGGYPIRLTDNKVFYVYSRKHGDLERDYNYFSMLPEYYSQGNGNFRDINQNRRCDVFFSPFVGKENIRMFYSLLQMDGYNPLKVEMVTYLLSKAQAEETAGRLTRSGQTGDKEELAHFLAKPFTPGQLWRRMEALIGEEKLQEQFEAVLERAHASVNGDFGEGYWSDHWTYNLDLVENYLSVFPEKERELFFTREYTWFKPACRVNPRCRRYAKTKKGIRQYYAVEEEDQPCSGQDKLVRDCGQGIVYATLLEKLLVLSAVKYATLDPWGCGVEMEGGKPGWYDALNGMPGLFGSSMAESYELGRNLEYLTALLEKYPEEIEIFEEGAAFIKNVDAVTAEEQEALMQDQQLLSFWNKINDAKESYRAQIYGGVSGRLQRLSGRELLEMVQRWLTVVRTGIRKACAMEQGICPTYLTFEVTEYEESEAGIRPLAFVPKRMPLFLEGPVRFMKLSEADIDKKALYERVKRSDLFDRKLSMYKVNASLEEASHEIGRARAFTPGWLENESIWLHMEYKYLLELLKSGLYEEFFEDFAKAAIPFQDPERYGRSILENSSFLASSRNPDVNIHGKGFVARLSGSTVEMIQMWIVMFFGKHPYREEEGELVFCPAPAIPEYLICGDHTVSARLMKKTEVVYHMEERKNYFPGGYRIAGMTLQDKNGLSVRVEGEKATGETARGIREGKYARIDIRLI